MTALVSASHLAAGLGRLRVLDATWFLPTDKRNAAALFAAGHIPGAVPFDIDAIADPDTDLPHMLPSQELFARRLAAMNVTQSDGIVVCEAEGVFGAPRAWWMLRCFGHDNVAVLDGGLTAWREGGFPLEPGAYAQTTPGPAERWSFRPSLLATLEDVRAAAKERSAQVVDARSEDRFQGKAPEPRPGLASGHIPHSLNVPYRALLSADGTKLLPPDALREVFARRGVDLAKPVITSCGSGVTACIIALALHLLNIRDVAVYDGSWAEWAEWGRKSMSMPVMAPHKSSRHTVLVTGGRHGRDFGGLVNPPVYRGSTVLFPNVAELEEATRNPFGRTFYGRMGTPTTFAFEEAAAALYGADINDSVHAVATSSGLAAIACALTAFTKAGDTILIADTVYAPTRRFCENVLARFGVRPVFYDPLIGSAIAALMDDSVALVFMESPGSLTLEVQDVPAIVKEAGARGIVTMLDNTWATALYFNPLACGVDVVLESATKYIAGHADASLGLMLCRKAHLRRLKESAVACGNAAGPDDCYLGQRGLRSLGVRLPRHEANAMELASWLKRHPLISRVLHPAFADCPGHALWRRDFKGASGLFSVVLRKATAKAVAAMLDPMELFGLGYSWGGYESLILPVTPSASRSATVWRDAEPVIRIHAGLEDCLDLRQELEAGLRRLQRAL